MSQPAQSTVSSTPVNRWLQLTACIFAMAAIANLQYAWTLFTIPLAESLQASLTAIQLTFTLFVLAETWLVPVEGYLIDRFGARLVVAIGGVLVALGWVGSGYAQSVLALYFWYTLGGAGAGAVYGASIGTALKWFPDRRGFAAGLAAGAFGFGTALTIIPIQNMIDSSGYRHAFIVWGIIQGIIVILAAMVLSKPPKGWTPPGWAGPAAANSPIAQSLRSYTPLEMVKTPSFWMLYVMMAMVAFGGLMVAAQLKPIAAIYGMDKTLVGFGMTALTLALFLDRIVNGLTRPLWGWISDHIGRYNAMGISFCLEAVGILALIMLIDRPIWFVILSGFVFFAWGNIYSLFPAAIGDLFGPEYATTNYGIQYTAKGTASIFAGVGAAWLVDMTGSWAPVFWTAAACDFMAAILAFLWLKPYVARLAAKRTSAPQAPVTATAVS